MSIDVAYSAVPAKRPCLTVGWKLLEQGPESQSASRFCSGGVSAVISASDLDDQTLHPDRRTAYPLSCSLPSGRNPTTLRLACRGAAGTQPPQLTVRRSHLVAEARSSEQCDNKRSAASETSHPTRSGSRYTTLRLSKPPEE